MQFDANLWNSLGLSTIASSIVTSGIVAGIIQVLFKARYDKRLESHKAQLSAQQGREIEKIRAESTIATERFKKSYGLLAERQADTIEKVYGLLADLHIALLRCVSPGRFGGEPTDAELLKDLHDKRWLAMDYFRQKRLFFSPDISLQIENIFTDIVGSESTFRHTVPRENKTPEDWKVQMKLWEDANGKIALALHNLEDQFRLLLLGGLV